MILVLGHVARVHPTANSLLCAVCRYESGERTQLPCWPWSRINPDGAHLRDADNPSNWINSGCDYPPRITIAGRNRPRDGFCAMAGPADE